MLWERIHAGSTLERFIIGIGKHFHSESMEHHITFA